MGNGSGHRITRFRDQPVPMPLVPVGYAAIIAEYVPDVPDPYTLCGIIDNHHPPEGPQVALNGSGRVGWRLFSPRYHPGDTLTDHLTFALRYEGINLIVLSRLFPVVRDTVMEEIVRATPTGSYSRRLWFLYEWLTGNRLDLPDADRGNYVPVVDPDRQYAVPGTRISRQRVINNLPGTPSFCPMVSRTSTLQSFPEQALLDKARAVLDQVPGDIVARTAAFLLLKDSRSSYAIEGESPPHSRVERWGRIIGQAGTIPVSIAELERLQSIVIGTTPFVTPGLRTEGGFVGEHDRETGTPIPEHISARPEDLPDLMDGLTVYTEQTARELPTLVAATGTAFGFVYIHPFSDGNGRIHRYLVHHVLAGKGFGTPGIVFPVSSVFLARIDEYRAILQGWSHRLLPYISWEETADHNVRVTNSTAAYYQYPDLTPHAEFVASCIAETIEEHLPRETAFLQRYDTFRRGVTEIVDMPDRTINRLFRFLESNDGTLPARRRRREFSDLTEEQLTGIQRLFSAGSPY
ncbi:MAG: Fic family protein [Spirochaeta sp.]|nr:Fic family protein [Spirochaeta sp.]